MNARYLWLLLSLSLGFALCGCHHESALAPAPPYPLSDDTVVRIHWLGKKRLGVDAGAYLLTRLWQLPASAQLETQTIDKVSGFIESSAWHGARPPTLPPQAVHAVLRVFCRDIVDEESFLEIRQPTNQPAEYLLAIRLGDSEAGFWQTNSAVLLESLTGALATPAASPDRGWSLAKPGSAGLIQLTQVAGWTVISASPGKSVLLDDVLSRTRAYRNPFDQPGTNYWLQAHIDPLRAARALGLDWSFPTNTPKISLSLSGDGASVLTHAELIFPAAPHIDSQPWEIPANLVREPLTSFCAVRGIKPLLDSCPFWQKLQFGPAPDQFYVWSRAGSPFDTFFAAPVPDARDRVHQLTGRLIASANPWLTARGYIPFEALAGSNGVTWGNLPSVRPFLTSVRLGDGEDVFGGLWAGSNFQTNPPVTESFFQPFAEQTNLIYYQWEMTGKRIAPWLEISQTARTVLRHPPLPMDSTVMTWLGIIGERLGESTTRITRTGSNQLSFHRKSTVGLTAPELHLLVDWLESPQFPRGLYTLQPPKTSSP